MYLAQGKKVLILLRIIFHVDMTNYRYSEDIALVDMLKTSHCTRRILMSQYSYHSLRGVISITNKKKSKATEKSEWHPAQQVHKKYRAGEKLFISFSQACTPFSSCA